jgi:uncharacterized protein (TIGR03000 family)
MFRRGLAALAVAAVLLVVAVPARAQMSGFRGGLTPIPSLMFGSPFGLPFVAPGYYPYVPGANGFYSGNFPVAQGSIPGYGTPVLPSDYQRPQRGNATGLPGRPRQKIEEFDPPAKASRPAADIPSKATTAQLEVRVPAEAEVWINGDKNGETGTVRHYESPALEPGKSSDCEVRVRRKGAAGDTDEIRHVTLRAGERRTVEIMSRPEAGPTPKPDKR